LASFSAALASFFSSFSDKAGKKKCQYFLHQKAAKVLLAT
jgi:hypothetical protein